MYKTHFYTSIFCMLFVLNGCNEMPKQGSQAVADNKDPRFTAYWRAGKAEISSYTLQQARYGEIRNGEAVLIFVTEDFSKLKQVKLDDPSAVPDDVLPVLKMNLTRKFMTGIYPYSMMLSVFTPTNINPVPVKITATSQEWCGHTFTQLNHERDLYGVRLFSYFEKEADSQFTFTDTVMTEDGIWNRIRISPETLPQGKQLVVPGSLYQRLSHTKVWIDTATCTVSTVNDWQYYTLQKGNVMCYTIQYVSTHRRLEVFFEKAFPHSILGWKETYPDLNKKMLTTTAIRNKHLMLDYWNHNSLADSVWRDSLQIKHYHIYAVATKKCRPVNSMCSQYYPLLNNGLWIAAQ